MDIYKNKTLNAVSRRIYLSVLIALIALCNVGDKFVYSNDEVITNALQLLSTEKKNTLNLTSELDQYYFAIAVALFKTGKKKTAIDLTSEIKSQHLKYRLISFFVQSKTKVNLCLLNLIKEKMESITNSNLRITLYVELFEFYLARSNIDNAKKVFDRLLEFVRKNSENISNEFFLSVSLPLTSQISQAGLKYELEAILKKAETEILKKERLFGFPFEVSHLLLDSYIKLGRGKDIDRIMVIIKKEAQSESISDLMYLSFAFFKCGKYQDSERMMDLICQYFEQKKERSVLAELISFIGHQQINDTEVLKAMLLKSGIAQRLRDIILEKIRYKYSVENFQHIGDFENFNSEIMEFLVSFSFLDEVKSIADKLDANFNCNKYNDYFHYYLSCEYMNLEKGRTIHNQTNIEDYFFHDVPLKIKEYLFLRIDLYLKGADIYLRRKDEKRFISLMDEAIILLKRDAQNSRGNCILMTPGAEHVALKWLEGDFPLRALETVKYIDNVNSRDNVLYQIIQYYIHLGNLDEARKVIKKLSPDSDLKNLITAKIAAHLMCVNKSVDARRLFSSAIKNEIGSKGDYFGKIMDNYVNAVKYKRKIIDNLLFFPSIEKY